MNVLSCECVEHGQFVKRNVWRMTFSPANIQTLWEKSKEHRILFTDDVNGDFTKFCNIFLNQHGDNIGANGLVWIVDDFVGMLFMSDIREREARLHFSFFDGRLRYDISKEMINYIFHEYGFSRLNAEIVPFANRRVFEFIQRLGFKKEGEKRKAIIYKSHLWGLHLYGLLREEFEDIYNKEIEDGIPSMNGNN